MVHPEFGERIFEEVGETCQASPISLCLMFKDKVYADPFAYVLLPPPRHRLPLLLL